MRQIPKNAILIILTIAAMALTLVRAVMAGPPDVPDHITRAVASEERPQADQKRDADRKPGKVLAFFGIKPGMTVLDINSGGGYYTEIVSRAVGENGKVYAHNDDLFYQFVKDGLPKRYEGRLENVEQIRSAVPEIKVEPNSVDVALLILALHDFYFTPENRPEPVDVPAAFAAIKAALKPGGVFGIVDHAAKAGSPPETGNTVHRIDEEHVKRLALEAGFLLEKEADFLRNSEDDRTQSPFTESLRGKTDRFVYRFRKPE